MTYSKQASAVLSQGKSSSLVSISGRKAALLTKHEKLPLINAAMLSAGVEVILTDEYDTDELGTFSGDVARTLSPLECAKFKARKACELTGCELGIGSEGSFGGGPMQGFVNWDEEILVLHDRVNQFDIVAFAQGAIKVNEFSVTSRDVIKTQLAKYDPGQAWTLKSADSTVKGLRNFQEIARALEELNWLTDDNHSQQSIHIEPDFRAMFCPERQAYIKQAAEQLAQRIQSLCPECHAPDFWRSEIIKGAICMGCGLPTELPKAFILRCSHCLFEGQEKSETQLVDPGQCQFCNP